MAEPFIRPIREEDVKQIHEIEKACFAMPWSEESILHDVKENVVARWLVLDDGNGGVLAYAGMWFVLDEAHVCNVAVRPDCRGKGYGKRIFTALIDLANGLRERVSSFRRTQFQQIERIAESFAEHTLIVEAILARDVIAAYREMRSHLLAARSATSRVAPQWATAPTNPGEK